MDGDLRLNCEVVHVRASDEAVDVDYVEKDGGTTRSLRAKYVLIADGGSSPIRTSMQIPYDGDSFPDQPWLVFDAKLVRDAYLDEPGAWVGRTGV
jgi:3-(3-hydroxy-phenyl)propionate hydroxylase